MYYFASFQIKWLMASKKVIFDNFVWEKFDTCRDTNMFLEENIYFNSILIIFLPFIQGRLIQICLKWFSLPHLPITWGRGKLAPNQPIIRIQEFKIQSYLVLKGVERFWSHQACFLDDSRGVSRKKFRNTSNLTLIVFWQNFLKISPKFFMIAPSAPKISPESWIIGEGTKCCSANIGGLNFLPIRRSCTPSVQRTELANRVLGM